MAQVTARQASGEAERRVEQEELEASAVSHSHDESVRRFLAFAQSMLSMATFAQ
jgi:hypothetical protein